MEHSEWIKRYFQYCELNYALKDLYVLRDIGLDKLLDGEYAIALNTEVMLSHRLENKIANKWYDYILENKDTVEDKLYQYAKGIFDNDPIIMSLIDKYNVASDMDTFFSEKTDEELQSLLNENEYEQYCAYKYDTVKVIANWSNRIRFLLKLDLQEDEAAVRNAIKEYIQKSGIEGIAGISIHNTDEINSEVEVLDDNLCLCKIYKCIKHEFNQQFEKEGIEDNPFAKVNSSDEQTRFMKVLLSKMIELDPNGFGVTDILNKVKQRDYKKMLMGNVNLGLEELELIFLKHGSLWRYETKDTEQSPDLVFRDDEEIIRFLTDYFRIIITSEQNEGDYKKNFVNRLSLLRTSEKEGEYMVQEILNCILNESERKKFQSMQDERRKRYDFDIQVFKEMCESDSWRELQMFLFSDLTYKNELESWDNANSPLNNYFKFDMIEALMERNIRDFIVAIDVSNGKDAVECARALLTQIECYALSERCLCMHPISIRYEPSMHEAYANALRRNALQTRCKHYYNIFTSMLENCLCYDNGMLRVNPDYKKCDDFEGKISMFSDKGLGEALKGSRDTDIKGKKEVVKRTSEWLNSTGLFSFDVEKYCDFKIIYDLLFKFKVSSGVSENGLEIKITNLKGKKSSPEDYTHYEKAYLVLGAFISKFFNREDLDEEDFVEICIHIRDAIVVLFNILEIPNSDYVLILMNAFRESCFAIMEQTRNINL